MYVLGYPSWGAGKNGLLANVSINFSNDTSQLLGLNSSFQGDAVYPFALIVSNLTSSNSVQLTIGQETEIVPPYSITTIDVRGQSSVIFQGTSGQSITAQVTNYRQTFGTVTPGPGPTSSTPTDPFFSKVVGLYHFNEANGSIISIDSSNAGFGALSQHTTNSFLVTYSLFKFGSGSGKFPGGATLGPAASTQNSIALTYPFTVEHWIYADSPSSSQNVSKGISNLNAIFFTFLNWQTNGFLIGFSNNNATNTYYAPNSLNYGQWYNVAFVMASSAACFIFIDGNIVLQQTGVVSGTPSATQFSIYSEGNYGYPNIFYDELRITSGVARYTNNYAVQTAEFPNQ